LSRQADKRSHLDLQIDLLAEREMTAVHQWLQDIADHLRVETSVTPEQLRDLISPCSRGPLQPSFTTVAQSFTHALHAA